MEKLRAGNYLLANPFTESPIEPDEIDLLINRVEERQRVDEIITSAGRGYPQHLAVLGEDGMGKTSLLNYVQAKCSITSGVYFSRIDITADTSEFTLIRFLTNFVNLFPEHSRFRLKPFEVTYVRELVEKRLQKVRKIGRGIEPFSERAIQALHVESQGNPRYIIRLAGFALYLARDDQRIEPEHILKASDQIYTELGKDRFDRLGEEQKELVLLIGKYPNSNFIEISKHLGNKVPKSTVAARLNELANLGYIRVETLGREKRCSLTRAMQRYYRVVYE